ncbi:hypothetical protein VTK26DRAFT_3703 [Humicola hyalothermophila]
MDSTFLAVALTGFFLLAVAADAASVLLDVVAAMRDLVEGPLSVLGGDSFSLGVAATLLASLLACFLVLFGAYHPTAASSTRQGLESIAAGAARRANLACQPVIVATREFVNALGESRAARILGWMLGRFVLPVLLAVLRPFLPGIQRNYFLCMNWLEARAAVVVDFVCVDLAGRSERRRRLRSRELAACTRRSELDAMNKKVAAFVRDSLDAFLLSGCLKGKFEHLRPAAFIAREAAVPEQGPVPKLSLWLQFLRRVDLHVYVLDHQIRLVNDAISEDARSIIDLEVELRVRQREREAIEAQVQQCRLSERKAREASRRLVTSGPVRHVVEPQLRARGCTAQLPSPPTIFERIAASEQSRPRPRPRPSPTVQPRETTPASASNALVRLAPSAAVVPSPPAAAATAAEVVANPQHDSTAAAAAAVTPTIPLLPAPPLTADDILALAVATPLPMTLEEKLLDEAHRSLELNRA